MRVFEDIYVVYVMGPYRAPSEWEVRKNIERSADRAMEVRKLNRNGVARVTPVSPCLNNAFSGGEVLDAVILAGDMAVLRRCDAAITADGWENSKGTLDEIAEAKRRGIPVFHSVAELESWMDEKDKIFGVPRAVAR